MDHVNVGMIAPAFVYFPIWVAIERGFFGPRSIECGISVAGTTDGTTAALEKGEMQFAMVTPEGVINNAAKGGRLRLVEGNSNRAPLSLIGPVGQHPQPCCDYTARLRKTGAHAPLLQPLPKPSAGVRGPHRSAGGRLEHSGSPAEDRILPLDKTDYEHQPQMELDADAAPSPP